MVSSVLTGWALLYTFRFKAKKNTITWFLISACGLTYCYLNYYNEYLCAITGILIIIGSLLSIDAARLTSLFFASKIALSLLELAVGLFQFIKKEPLTGTFYNTGIFSIYLSISAASILHLLLYPSEFPGSMSSRHFRKLLLPLLACIVIVIILNRSRSSLFVLSFIMAGVSLQIPSHIFKRQFKQILVLLMAITVLVYSFSIKQGSSNGRILTSKIALQHIGDHFWWGTGTGKFTWYYPQWQATYFSNNPKVPANLINASGETYIIFNDLLQLLETIGALKMLMLILLLAFILRKKYPRSHPFHAIKTTLLSVALAGATSYPFHTNILILDAFLCILIGLKESVNPAFKTASSNGNTIQIRLLLIIFMVLSAGWWEKYIANERAVLLGGEFDLPVEERKQVYKDSYAALKKDGKFLTEYGILLLSDSTETRNAIDLLHQAKAHFISSATIEATGNAYLINNDYKNAAACYKWLTDYTPGLFLPKYILLQIYVSSFRMKEAKELAALITEMQPKVSSPEVWQIKEYAKAVLSGTYIPK
ncbi:O-antigen ligase family protein [Chitinophaga polysaccharea]|nr:O-antigen ligase family protein [Chitinophaga polysaccharea]